jgi:hypothetical protein
LWEASGLVGGHFIRSQKRHNLNTIFDGLDGIIYEDTGWNLSKIVSVLEIERLLGTELLEEKL